MPEWLTNLAPASWSVVLRAAPFILFGLFMAGVLHVYLPVNLVRKLLGGGGIGAVLRAAAIGVPLPLCSCGVIPVALHLRKEGARRGPVLSFLIATPETGVDSIAVTYALMGPVMAVARPIAALLTAIAAGLGELLFGAAEDQAELSPEAGGSTCDGRAELSRGRRSGGLRAAVSYGFVVLMRDLAPWLLLGLGLAGLVESLLPEDFFQKHGLGPGSILSMVLMLLVSMPMYMCATGSTPIAAAMMGKGLSPGAALVFLLAGPATNVATMLAVGRFLGKRSLAIYLGTIFGVSLLLGFALDALAGTAGLAAAGIHGHAQVLPEWLAWGSALLFLVLLANGLRLRLVPYWMLWRDRRSRPTPAAPEPAGVAAPAPSADQAVAPSKGPGREAECPHCKRD